MLGIQMTELRQASQLLRSAGDALRAVRPAETGLETVAVSAGRPRTPTSAHAFLDNRLNVSIAERDSRSAYDLLRDGLHFRSGPGAQLQQGTVEWHEPFHAFASRGAKPYISELDQLGTGKTWYLHSDTGASAAETAINVQRSHVARLLALGNVGLREIPENSREALPVVHALVPRARLGDDQALGAALSLQAEHGVPYGANGPKVPVNADLERFEVPASALNAAPWSDANRSFDAAARRARGV